MEQDKPSEDDSSLFALTFDPQTTKAEPEPAEAGQPEAQPAPVEEEKGDPAPEVKADQPRDDAGRFAPKPKEPEAAPPAADREQQHVPVAALKDERTKRQALEAEVAQMRQLLTQMQQQAKPAPQQPAEKPDPIGAMLDNPQGFVEERATQVARQMVAPLEDQMFRDRLNFSVQRARSAPDFEEADALVNAAIQAAPPQIQQRLAAEMRRHPDPGQWVLDQGRAIKERQEFLAWKQSRNQPAPAPEPVAQPAPSASAQPLPASLATARGIGASRQPEGPSGSPFDGIWRS